MVIKKAYVFIFLTLAGVLCSCGDNISGKSGGPPSDKTEESTEPAKPMAVYQKISAEEAKSMMESGNLYILLDVRTDEEFEAGHIEGAVLIPDYEIKDRVKTKLPDKEALILVYCRSGRRSANAAHEMVAMGYTNVYDFGGIIDWPYDTVGG
jgi:rhodanese-related sulfurtransferase